MNERINTLWSGSNLNVGLTRRAAPIGVEEHGWAISHNSTPCESCSAENPGVYSVLSVMGTETNGLLTVTDSSSRVPRIIIVSAIARSTVPALHNITIWSPSAHGIARRR